MYTVEIKHKAKKELVSCPGQSLPVAVSFPAPWPRREERRVSPAIRKRRATKDMAQEMTAPEGGFGCGRLLRHSSSTDPSDTPSSSFLESGAHPKPPLASSARDRTLTALPRKEQRRVVAAFDVLRENPFAGKKLQGEHQGAWSLRVWPYRILYTIHQEIVTVTVLRVAHRQGAYN